jgi:ankyrin repeat protein
MVESLLDRGADINGGGCGTSLHYAAAFGRLRNTQLLLE